MPDKKLTDNEIMKALECCNMRSGKACSECPYHEYYDKCIGKRNADIVDLINRQKAEIERVKSGCKKLVENQRLYRDNMEATREWQIETAKAEAVKEFAKLLIEWAQDGSVPVCDLPDIVAEFLGGDADGTVPER